jgi:Tol biopolymer transport system component
VSANHDFRALQGESERGGIYVSRPDRSGRRALITDMDAVLPAWSPDGSQIAFVMRGDLYVIAPNGSGLRRLTLNPVLTWTPWGTGPFAWSPDGQRIAFVSERSSGGGDRIGALQEIYVINADGSRERRLTRNSVMDMEPSWSPDGSKIAFARDDGGLCEESWDDCLEIYVMNADGSDQHRLTDNPKLDEQPSWSSGTFEYVGPPDLSNGAICPHDRALRGPAAPPSSGSFSMQTAFARSCAARIAGV